MRGNFRGLLEAHGCRCRGEDQLSPGTLRKRCSTFAKVGFCPLASRLALNRRPTSTSSAMNTTTNKAPTPISSHVAMPIPSILACTICSGKVFGSRISRMIRIMMPCASLIESAIKPTDVKIDEIITQPAMKKNTTAARVPGNEIGSSAGRIAVHHQEMACASLSGLSKAPFPVTTHSRS